MSGSNEDGFLGIDELLGLDKEPAFKGQTYDEELDFARLSNNLQRVFVLMLDGKWHRAEELREVGGSEATRRARDLRGEMWGPLDITVERLEGGTWRYRLDLDSVTDHIKAKILNKNPDDPPRTKALRIEHIKGILAKATDEQLCAVEKLLGIDTTQVDIDLLDLG